MKTKPPVPPKAPPPPQPVYRQVNVHTDLEWANVEYKYHVRVNGLIKVEYGNVNVEATLKNFHTGNIHPIQQLISNYSYIDDQDIRLSGICINILGTNKSIRIRPLILLLLETLKVWAESNN